MVEFSKKKTQMFEKKSILSPEIVDNFDSKDDNMIFLASVFLFNYTFFIGNSVA